MTPVRREAGPRSRDSIVRGRGRVRTWRRTMSRPRPVRVRGRVRTWRRTMSRPRPIRVRVRVRVRVRGRTWRRTMSRPRPIPSRPSRPRRPRRPCCPGPPRCPGRPVNVGPAILRAPDWQPTPGIEGRRVITARHVGSTEGSAGIGVGIGHLEHRCVFMPRQFPNSSTVCVSSTSSNASRNATACMNSAGRRSTPPPHVPRHAPTPCLSAGK